MEPSHTTLLPRLRPYRLLANALMLFLQLAAASVRGQEQAVEASLVQMRKLVEARDWKEFASRFNHVDLASSKESPAQVSEAASLRAKAYVALKDGKAAERDLRLAVERSPKRGELWMELGALYTGILPNDDLAIEAYEKAYASYGKSFGWVSLGATIYEANLLLKLGKVEDASRLIARYDTSDLVQIAGTWHEKMIDARDRIAERMSASLLILADKGSSDYQIVLPDEHPTPAIGQDLRSVARLVQTAFKAQGVEIPVVNEADRDTARPSIYLGNTRFARAQRVECAGWTYVHKVVGRDLILAGKDEPGPKARDAAQGGGFARIGSAKAAVDFLHRFVGTRFLFPEQGGFQPLANVSKVDLLNSPTIEYLPTPRVAVPRDLEVKVTPPLDYDIAWPPTMSFYHLSQNRFPTIDATFGGHTWHRAVPADEAAFKAHPERFALLGGKRQLTGSGPSVQFCLSNPDVQKMLHADLEDLFQRGFRTVDLGQPDGFRGCECEACAKLFNTGSDWSEKVWNMHRELAQRANEKFPDRTVCISVYAVTETLPKSFKSMPPNVQLMLAGTRDPEIAVWKDFGAPRGFSVYLYYWTPNQMPVYFPTRTPLYVESAAKRLLAANVRSIYRDGNGGVAYGLEGPTYYTMGRMFDGHGTPNAKDLVVEYVTAAFGKSAPAMMRFYEDLFHSLEIYSRYMATREDGWSYSDMYGRKRKHLQTFEPLMAFLYPSELLNTLDKHLTLAEKTDSNPKVKMRLALVRAEFNFLRDTVNTVHLYNAHRASADPASLDRLLDAIDARRNTIDQLFVKENRLPGWPFTLFPTPGHTADSMKMRRDGYQESYSSSFLNWDTKAKRLAPLPNAKRLSAGQTKGAVSIDSPEWDRLTPGSFSGTSVRALSSDRELHLRFEIDAAEGTNPEQERIEVYLTPVQSSPITYLFRAGLKTDSREQAARGLNEDLMDLAHAKFDPLWKAVWSHAGKRDGNRLTLLLSIPLASMRSAEIRPDQPWSVNFRRANAKGTNAWSTLPGSTNIDDPRSHGELLFQAGGSATGNTALKAAREKAWKDTFETPSEWRPVLKNATIIPLSNWRFRADPTEMGLKERWFTTEKSVGTDWHPMQVPTFWGESEAIGNFQGEGWYQVAFTVPESARGKALRLLFAGVDEQAWIYLNGQQIGEHSVQSEAKPFTQLYDAPFAVDIPSSLLSKENVLHVRVHNQVGAGGIWRPVHLIVK